MTEAILVFEFPLQKYFGFKDVIWLPLEHKTKELFCRTVQCTECSSQVPPTLFFFKKILNNLHQHPSPLFKKSHILTPPHHLCWAQVQYIHHRKGEPESKKVMNQSRYEPLNSENELWRVLSEWGHWTEFILIHWSLGPLPGNVVVFFH